MFSRINSMGVFGIDAFRVYIEADLSAGFPGFEIVGLPDAAVKESRDRVKAALKNSGFLAPKGRITVNLAPADIKKEGSMYDLPIVVSLLAVSGQLDKKYNDSAFIGEISLDGMIRSVKGLLSMAITAEKAGIKSFFVPAANAREASVVKGIKIYPVNTVKELVEHLKGSFDIPAAPAPDISCTRTENCGDFSEVKGQSAAKKALEMAAAGGHNLLMIGPPGSGKSMLAKRLPSILPEMSFEESIETTKIHSVAGMLSKKVSLITERPFRAPHHTVSAVALTGGGATPRPGEISLANGGVLFLDELPEFSRSVIESLRAPLEDGAVTVSRAAGRVTYPCDFTLIAAMNPCPCGYYGSRQKACRCSQRDIRRYLDRVSGPLLDRIDIQIEVDSVPVSEISQGAQAESSAAVRERVCRAREIQQERYRKDGIYCNAALNSRLMRKHCELTDEASNVLHVAVERMGMSMRGYSRVLKVARTIADLAGEEKISAAHIAEAISLRELQGKYWK